MLANVFSNTTPPRVEKDEGVPLLRLPDASRKSESVRVRGEKKRGFVARTLCCAYSTPPTHHGISFISRGSVLIHEAVIVSEWILTYRPVERISRF
jgi:hypothetical protein